MALLFSAVTVTAGYDEAKFTVGGIPREYDDLVGWTAFDDFMENVGAETEVSVHAEVYLYGGEETVTATPEEVAYLTMRMERDDRFLAGHCDHIEAVDMMQRLIPKAAYEEERKSVKMQITDISDKISERRAKRVPESEYVSITEFSEEKAKRFLSKVVVTMFTVTFVFYNGAKITRTYDNGQPGNKVGWNKKKEES